VQAPVGCGVRLRLGAELIRMPRPTENKKKEGEEGRGKGDSSSTPISAPSTGGVHFNARTQKRREEKKCHEPHRLVPVALSQWR